VYYWQPFLFELKKFCVAAAQDSERASPDLKRHWTVRIVCKISALNNSTHGTKFIVANRLI